MSLKKLFGKGIKSYQSASVNVESPDFVTNKVKENETYLPPIDFASASNFVKYGLAELYYEKSISRIYDDYPYDGSKAEIINFHQSSSYLDRWMYEEKYPKTTGYITMGTTGYQGGKDAAGYGKTTTNEYIRVWGGIHTASSGMSGKPLSQTFDKSGKYDLDLNRTQNWRVNPVSGSTVEFWLKIPDFDTSLTNQMVVMDVWNGIDPYATSTSYSRFQIRVNKTSTDQNLFRLVYVNNGSGFNPLYISNTLTDAHMAEWHHYAFTIIEDTDASKYDLRFYIDGVLTREQKLSVGFGSFPIPEFGGLLNGYLGALQATNVDAFSNVNAVGSGKLSGSLDEFRYWKKARTGQQIGLNWFRQIGGGANTDDETANKTLGVYFKFNEGITETVSIDKTVLDYSGRLANGYWEGYSTETQRNTGSAMASSSYAYREDENPIIYSTHPRVVSLQSEMQTSGSLYDREEGSSIFFSMPEWIVTDDTEEGSSDLKYLTQILSSYFDTLHAQITALPHLKDKTYYESDQKPLPFASELLSDKGFITRDILVDSDIVNLFSGVDFNSVKFQENLDRTKQLIYTNIYNNLEAIYKSKGTEKSVRNFIRCFGIDDEIVKLNVYTDGGTHYFTDKAKASSVKKKYINFDDPEYFSSTIFQTTGSVTNNPITFISGSTGSADARNTAFTLEADIVVPYKKESTELGYYDTPFLTSSIFGFREAWEGMPNDYGWVPNSVADLSVFLVRDEPNSKNAKFLIKSADNSINLTSSYFQKIYDNNHWNLAVRVKPDTYPYTGGLSTGSAPTYTLDFYAANYNFDVLENEVRLTASLTTASGSAYLCNAKRVYAGAYLTDFTSSLVHQSDIQVGSFRAWLDYIEDSAIQQHNKDPLNYGISKSYRDSNIYIAENKNVSSQELTIFNWEFDTITGSSADGYYTVNDITSGSSDIIYNDWLDNLIRREYRGIGYGFGASKTTFVENEFLYAQKKELPEISYTNDNIFIKTDKDINFIKDDDVSDNFYTLEKSMNQIVSEEILKMFSSVQEFANLMGRPVDRYRQNYKRLDKVREDFFSRVEGNPDQERFIQFYKWIDGNISKMIRQLVPASVNFGSGVSDVVESHILERNKYQRRIGLLEQLESTEGSMKGVEELTYNYKFGSAPVLKTATGMLKITGDPGNTERFELTDANGCGQVFITDTTSNTVDGSKNADGRVIVGIQSALGTVGDIRDRFVSAIKASALNGDIAIKATSDGSNELILAQQIAGTTGNTTINMAAVANVTSTSFTGGEGSQNEHCVWQKERKERSTAACQSSVGSDREALRKIIVNQTNATSSNLSTVNKTIYQGSTYAARRLSRPYKVGIEMNNTIHGGINYPPQKDREFFKSVTTYFGGKDASGAPENIYTVGLSTGSAFIHEQVCHDVYDPSAKKYKHFECVVGKNANGPDASRPYNDNLDYVYKMNSRMYWPFNVVSGSLQSGYNKWVHDVYNTSSIVVNVHSDTIDLTNEIPIQGPFTQAHVGGNQSRHIDLNKSSSINTPNGLDTLYHRPELYRYLFGENPIGGAIADGAMGLTGPDYGGPYPDTTKQFAVYFREERAKRPVNIKNIQTTTASAVHGNYQHKYEVVSTFGMTSQRFRMRNELTNYEDGLFGTNYSTLPQTTQPQSLFGVGNLLNSPEQVVINSQDSDWVKLNSDAINDGKQFIFSLGALVHVITIDQSVDYTASTATVLGTLNANTAAKVAAGLVSSLTAAKSSKLLPIISDISTFASLGFHQIRFTLAPGEFVLQTTTDPSSFWLPSVANSRGAGGRLSRITGLPSQLSGALPQKTIVRTKFSAPGSPETLSEAFLNISSLELSAYNALPFRNLTVRSSGSGEPGTIRVVSNTGRREGLQTMLRRHTGKFGIDSEYGVITSGSIMKQPAAFFKQHRNTLVRPKIVEPYVQTALSGAALPGMGGAVTNNLSTANLVFPIDANKNLSFSFWINCTGVGTGGTIFSGENAANSNAANSRDTSYLIQMESSGLEIYVYQDGEVRYWQGRWSGLVAPTNGWKYVVICWDDSPIYPTKTMPKVYVDGIEIATGTQIANTFSADDIQPILKYKLFGSFGGYSLQGSLRNFAIWNKYLTADEVTKLWDVKGELSKNPWNSVIDDLHQYWTLGGELIIKQYRPETPIPVSTIIPSSIGKLTLTAGNQITASTAPFWLDTWNTQDVNQYNNMNYNSLLPRSDFQYAWIRNTLSGGVDADGNGFPWMDKQKVRGYAPKSGEISLQDGYKAIGSQFAPSRKQESAINWPLISDVACGEETFPPCEDVQPTITIKWSDGAGTNYSHKSSDSTTKTFGHVLHTSQTTANDISIGAFNSMIVQYSGFDNCCNDIEYDMQLYGHFRNNYSPFGYGERNGYEYAGWTTVARTWMTDSVSPMSGTVSIPYAVDAYPDIDDGEVKVKILARCGDGDGQQASLVITFAGDASGTPGFAQALQK